MVNDRVDGDNKYVFQKTVYSMSGIGDIHDDASAVSVTYADLTGRVVDRPTRGMYINTIRFSDGTISVEKLLIP